MSELADITIDGRTVAVERGSMLLDAIRAAGGDVPTLCHHPSLEPSGACRLCSVEVTHPDWGGWSGVVVSCLYPVEPGLRVSTRSPRVVELRRTLLELYLSRCPDAEEVRAMARSEGVEVSDYPLRENADKCVLCGLCTRVCNDLGPAALAPLGRGKDKEVGPRPDMVGEDCTNCGACALVCPTGHIVVGRRDHTYTIWNREFDIPVAKVNDERCRACGVCEEVCPEAIPRVQLFRGGDAGAFILAEACTGCGICVGACPTGAIEQEARPIAPPSGGDAVEVFACSRSTYPTGTENVNVVPCIGRVPVERVLESLAAGAPGVQLVCRDQASCPHAKGGALGEKHAAVADDLALLAGLGAGRVQYVKPAPGPAGPGKALREFAVSLAPNPLGEPIAARSGGGGRGSGAGEYECSGLDRALELMRHFRRRGELRPELPRSIAALFDDEPEGGAPDEDTVLYLSDMPELDLLLSGLIDSWRARDLIADAARLLGEKGISFVPALTVEEAEAFGPSRIVAFTERDLDLFDDSLEKTTLAALAGTATRSESGAPAAASAPAGPFRFRITREERRAWSENLCSTPDGPICDGVHEVAQLHLLRRQGAWQGAVTAAPHIAFAMRRSRAGGEAGS